ncbi:MAG: hypothetical protein JWP81_1085 [Ferruginibacter sp.]|nr:hypothetical protein [Ferruginibacter sp.]
MKNDNDLVEAAIIGGLVGAALEALITKGNKNSGLGILAGAVIAASLKANEAALKTKIPLVLKMDNHLYQVNADGTKKLIRKLPTNKKPIQKRFTLK